jgi:aryl-alcohol dehydrogenase-like predicted oxidoreductase
MNAAPFAARLLTNATLPAWHKATPRVREAAKAAADHCFSKGVDIAQLAVQFSVANPDMATCIIGSADPKNVRKWVEWVEKPIDQQLLAEVLKILAPVHNWHHIEGRPENNDRLTAPEV